MTILPRHSIELRGKKKELCYYVYLKMYLDPIQIKSFSGLAFERLRGKLSWA